MAQAVLTLNAGSSSLKFAVFELMPTGSLNPDPLLRGHAQGFGGDASLTLQRQSEPSATQPLAPDASPDRAHHGAALEAALTVIDGELGGRALVGVGHRVVHGGADFAEPVVLTDEVVAKLDALSPLAPGHQPHNLAGVWAARGKWPNTTNVACFDTAFHRSQPRVAQLFALPRSYAEAGVIRYGFHGLSYDYIASIAPDVIGEAGRGRMIVAHLGHGVSLCGLRDGQSVATTMGFTALDGMPMGKRCGAIDPGVLLHLLQTDGMTPEALADLLHHRSGLLGLSGVSDDMRALEASDAAEAREAIDYFIHRCVREIGGLAACLGGIDALVFTAGIGEHSTFIRAKVIDALSWLGFSLDEQANARGGPRLTHEGGAPSAWVLATNEEWVIAERTASLTGVSG